MVQFVINHQILEDKESGFNCSRIRIKKQFEIIRESCTEDAKEQLGSDYNISFPFNKGAFKIFCLERNSVANFGTCLEIIGSGLGLRLDAGCNARLRALKNTFYNINLYINIGFICTTEV